MTTYRQTNPDRRTAFMVGLLFLIAMLTSLGGGLWLESFLGAPDYLDAVSANTTQVVGGVLLELVNCIAVVGIAALMYPIIRINSGALAMGYAGFRIIEASILASAALVPLLLIAVSDEFLTAGAGAAEAYQALANVVLAARASLTGLLTATFFSCGALIFYYFLYQTRLVPRFISIWGFIAVPLMLIWNLLEVFGISISFGLVFGLLIILNEIFLGLWLMIKGFSSPAIAQKDA